MALKQFLKERKTFLDSQNSSLRGFHMNELEMKLKKLKTEEQWIDYFIIN